MPSVATDTSPARGFVGWLLAGVAMLVLAVGAANWWVDPLGEFAHGSDRAGAATSVLEVKLDLLQASGELDVVLIGSSRMHYYDAERVPALEDQRTLNLAIDGGFPAESATFARLVRARAREHGGRFPHLVVGVGLEELRADELQPEFAQHPWAGRVLGPDRALGERLRQRWTPLATMQVTRASVRAVRRNGLSTPSVGGGVGFRVDEDGVLVDGPLQRDAASGRHMDEWWERERELYERFYVDTPPAEQLAPGARDALRDLLHIATEAGDEPTIVLLPAHESARTGYGPLGRDLLHDRALEMLEELGGASDFHLLDLADDPDLTRARDGWYDPMHPSPEHSDRILARIAAADPELR